MNVLRFAMRGLGRDLRSGEVAVLVLALTIAVASLTAVGFFTSRVARAVDQQAGEVLAADLRLESARPIDPAYDTEARTRGLATARILSMPSVVFVGENSTLITLRAASDGYPLRGRLKVADRPFGPSQPADGVPARGEAWADSRLLAQLGVSVGSTLDVGKATFRVTRVLDYRPDQGVGFADLSSTLLVNLDDVPATGLIQPGSRVSYGALYAGDPSDVRDFRDWLDARRQKGERLKAVADASPQIRASSDRAGRFLSLASIVAVLISAIAVAMSARRYASRHLDTAALMKCMGASQRLVLTQSLVQLGVIAVSVAVLGTIAGYVAQQGLAWLTRDLVQGALPAPGPEAAWLGLATSVAVLVGFALPPMLQLRRAPPARVLRDDLEPPPPGVLAVYGLAAASVIGLLYLMIRDAQLVGWVAAGLLATFAALGAAGWLMVRALRPLRRGVGVAWRYGLANVARRGRESIVQVVAFGLGLTVLLMLALVRDDLLREWRASLPADAPNYFMINIRPDEGAAVREFLAGQGIRGTELVPMVRARLSAVNGVPVERLTFDGDRAQGFVERESNLTWAAALAPDNRIVAGRWWHEGDRGGPRVSVEQDYGTTLGLKLGDTLTYDVAGEPVTARITSLREVQWDSFRPNFFIVFSPGVLEDVTGTLITSAHVAPAQRPALVGLVHRFPEVTVIDVDALLSQVRGVMDKASIAVQYVFAFTLLAGLVVLLAAVQATRDERRYESAMLRTLGASRGVVLAGVAAEFVAIGLLAGLLASAGAALAGWLLAREVFELAYSPSPVVWIAGVLGGATLVGVAGVLAARSAVTRPPSATLREARG